MKTLTSSAILSCAAASYLKFNVYDSTTSVFGSYYPEGFMSYVEVDRIVDSTAVEGMPRWLVCTTCSFSYMFGDVSAEVAKSTGSYVLNMFKPAVEVTFVNMDLQMTTADGTGSYLWNMDVAMVDNSYKTSTYFDFYDDNVLGVAPSLTEDADLLSRQALYQFVNAASTATLGLKESIAFNGGQSFFIGGSQEDFKSLECYNQFGEA